MKESDTFDPTPFIESLSPESKTEISQLIESSPTLEALYEELASSEGLGAFPGDQIRKGRELFENWWNSNRCRFCSFPKVKQFCADPTVIDSQTTLALVIGGILSTEEIPFNIALVACIITRIGIRELCQKTWESLESENDDSSQ